jgi:DNA polymerase III delta subunit
MIITLTGSNSFALKRRLDELTGAFTARHGDLALERIDAEEAELPAIIEAISSLPFLSSAKMVIVRSLGANKPAAEAIEQVIDSIDEATEVIFFEPFPDKRTTYFKSLKKLTKLEEYGDLATPELVKWLVAAAENQNGQLSHPDAEYLVERVGTDQALLSNELQKLLSYNPKIDRQQIDLLTIAAPQSRIFDLLDAAFAGQKKRALTLYEEQRAQKVEPQAILAMVTWQLQLLAYAKYAKGRSPTDISRDTGLNPYPITKAGRLADKLTERRLKQLANDALNIDWQGKTTPLDMDEALKTYILTL